MDSNLIHFMLQWFPTDKQFIDKSVEEAIRVIKRGQIAQSVVVIDEIGYGG